MNYKKIQIIFTLICVTLLYFTTVYASSHQNQFKDKCYIEYKYLNLSNEKEQDYGYALAKDGDRYMTWSRTVSLGIMFSSAKNLDPTAYYEDDIVYHFLGKERVLYAHMDYVTAHNYYTVINWKKPIETLATPEVLIPLLGVNRFNKESKNTAEPVFERTKNEQYKGDNYSVDVYSSVVSNSAGKPMFTRHYYYYYDNDSLKYAKMTISANGGKESTKEIIIVKKISNELPNIFYKWKKEYKLSNADGESIDVLLNEAQHY